MPWDIWLGRYTSSNPEPIQKPVIYICGDPSCCVTGEKGEMYCLYDGKTPITKKGLPGLIRCSAHAAKLAKRNGIPVGKPGCGTMTLAYVLPKVGMGSPEHGYMFYCSSPRCRNCNVATQMLCKYERRGPGNNLGEADIIDTVVCPSCAKARLSKGGHLVTNRRREVISLAEVLQERRIIDTCNLATLSRDRHGTPR